MTRYLALLRAVNVGGSSRIGMDELRRLIEPLGFADVRTLGQSGNVVFRGPPEAPIAVERRLETRLARSVGLSTLVFVRTSEEWNAIVQRNPFPEEASHDPAHLTCWLLKEAPAASKWNGLRAGIRGREKVAGSGREAYLVYPDGIGRSPVTSALVERTLGTRGTARNWNTMQRLEGLSSGEST